MTVSEIKELLVSESIHVTLNLTSDKESAIPAQADNPEQNEGVNVTGKIQVKSSEEVNCLDTLSKVNNIDVFSDNGKRIHNSNYVSLTSEKPSVENLLKDSKDFINLDHYSQTQLDKNVAKYGVSNTSYSKIIFSTDQLFENGNKIISIKAIDSASNVVDYKISTKELTELVKNYPERITVEVRSSSQNIAEINNNVNRSQTIGKLSDTVLNTESKQNRIIVDLKAIVSKEDSSPVNIIRKIADVENLAKGLNSTSEDYKYNHRSINKEVLDYQLLRELKINNHSFIRTSTMPETKNNLVTVAAQVKPSEEKEIKNEKNKQAKYSEIQSKQNHNIKTEPVVETGKGNNTMPFNVDNSIKQQTSISTDSIPVDSLSEEVKSDIQSAIIKSQEKIDAIVNQLKSKLIVNPENTQVTIKLRPESLGKIRIDFNYQNEKVQAVFRVDNPEVKYILDLEMPKLKAEWKIDDYKVELNNLNNDSNSPNHHLSRQAEYERHEKNNNFYSSVKESEQKSSNTIVGHKDNHKVNYYGGAIDLVA